MISFSKNMWHLKLNTTTKLYTFSPTPSNRPWYNLEKRGSLNQISITFQPESSKSDTSCILNGMNSSHKFGKKCVLLLQCSSVQIQEHNYWTNVIKNAYMTVYNNPLFLAFTWAIVQTHLNSLIVVIWGMVLLWECWWKNQSLCAV